MPPPAPTAEAKDETPFNHDDYVCVTDEDALDRWIADALAAGVVAVDTETDNIDATRARLIGVSLGIAPNKACYIPIGHVGDGLLSENPRQLTRALVPAKLKRRFENAANHKVGRTTCRGKMGPVTKHEEGEG